MLSKHGNLREAKVHSDKEELLKKDLICNQCDYKPKNLPDLKKHLEKHLKNWNTQDFITFEQNVLLQSVMRALVLTNWST